MTWTFPAPILDEIAKTMADFSHALRINIGDGKLSLGTGDAAYTSWAGIVYDIEGDNEQADLLIDPRHLAAGLKALDKKGDVVLDVDANARLTLKQGRRRRTLVCLDERTTNTAREPITVANEPRVDVAPGELRDLVAGVKSLNPGGDLHKFWLIYSGGKAWAVGRSDGGHAYDQELLMETQPDDDRRTLLDAGVLEKCFGLMDHAKPVDMRMYADGPVRIEFDTKSGGRCRHYVGHLDPGDETCPGVPDATE